MVEAGEWERVNKALRQHGLPVVELAHPSKAESKSDLVMFEPEVSRKVRDNLKTLLRDCDRRQELIQELILTNSQLRKELNVQSSLSEQYEDKARDLANMLDSSKNKVQEMEEDKVYAAASIENDQDQLQNTLGAAKDRCRQLQQKCDTYEDEITRLKNKLDKMTVEDERRHQKQKEVFQQLRRKSSRGPIDDKILDLIDSYERQIYVLKHELELSKLGESLPSSNIPTGSCVDSQAGESQVDGPTTSSQTLTATDEKLEATPNYKALIKCYERQLRESRQNLKASESEKEVLKLELLSRPEMKDLREAQLRIKKLEKQLQKKGNENRDNRRNRKKYSTQFDDLDYLPAEHCLEYLKAICTEAGVSDVEHVVPKMQMDARSVEAFPRLEQFAREVLHIVDTSNVPGTEVCQRHSHSGHRPHQVWCEKSTHHVLPTLEAWLLQLKSLKELQHSINKLHAMLLPWNQTKLTGQASVMKLIEAVDCLVYDEQSPQEKGRAGKTEQPSYVILQGIVDHFMKLFDVKRVSGCYARMNDLYTKLGQVHNVMKTLKDLLGLGPEAKSTTVVDSVARLCQAHNTSSYEHLQQILPTQDLESVVKKLQQQEEFFPVFQELMQQLMEVLNVNRVDEVVPAVQALRVLADS